MNRLLSTFLFFLFLLRFTSYSQNLPATGEAKSFVKWLSFKEALELNKKIPKPFLIDIYTDWCSWCKKMMSTTYTDPNISGYINTWFYPVKFNAEGHDTIEWMGTKYMNTGKEIKSTHSLTFKLLGNQLTYPSTIFISNNFLFQLNTSGFLENKAIEPILVYTVENIFRTTAYEEFKSYFEKTFYDTNKIKTLEIKWYSLNEAEKLNKKQPRKFLIDIYTSWCNGCRVMNQTTFNDPHVKDYISKKFYLVNLNAETKDSLIYNGKTWYNKGSHGMPFHDLVMELTKRSLSLPTMIVMDENMKTVETIPYYISPITLEPILQFYGDNAYKTQKWQDYLQKFKEKKK